MIKRNFKQLLKKYKAGTLNEPATKFVDAWYESLDDYTSLADPLNDPVRAAAIQNTIYNNLLKHAGVQSKVRRIRPWHYVAAASVILVCTLSVWLMYSLYQGIGKQPALTYVSVITAPGVLKNISLPDSSDVWLNAGSRLRYVQNDFAKKREIFLDEGEAFFTVRKDPEHPFLVHNKNISTRVLGTEFNVKAYSQLNYASVMVKNGRVRVVAGEQKIIDTVTASQSITFNKTTGKVYKNTADPTVADGWVTGMLVLHEANFAELALLLHNRYNITLHTNNKNIRLYHYTINIVKQQSADAALKLICAIHQNKYRRINNEIIIY